MNVGEMVPGLRQRQRERSAAILAGRRRDEGGDKVKEKKVGGKGRRGGSEGRPPQKQWVRGVSHGDRDRKVFVRVVKGSEGAVKASQGGHGVRGEGGTRSSALARYDQAWASSRRPWREDEVPEEERLLTCEERLLASITRLSDVVPRAKLARKRLEEMRAGVALVDRIGAAQVEKVDLPAARALQALAVEERSAADAARIRWEFLAARQEAMVSYAHGRLLHAAELDTGDGPYRKTEVTSSERVQTDVAIASRAWFRGHAVGAKDSGRKCDDLAGALEDVTYKLGGGGLESMLAGVERQERAVEKWNEVERRLKAMRRRAVRESAGLGRLPAKDSSAEGRIGYVSSVPGRDLVWPTAAAQ